MDRNRRDGGRRHRGGEGSGDAERRNGVEGEPKRARITASCTRRTRPVFHRTPDASGSALSGFDPAEAGRHAVALAALPRRRYARGLSVSAAVDELPERLVECCERVSALVVAGDGGAAPGDPAMPEPCATIEWMSAALPEGWPRAPRDLIVLSGALEGLDAEDVRTVAHLAAHDLEPGGALVVLGALDGAEAPIEALLAALEGAPLAPTRHVRLPRYRLDVLEAGG